MAAGEVQEEERGDACGSSYGDSSVHVGDLGLLLTQHMPTCGKNGAELASWRANKEKTPIN